MGNKHIRGEVSVKMKDVTAFKTASQVIADEMQEKGTMSYERAAEILNMYENAFTVVKRHFPLAQCGTDILLKADLLLMEHGCTGENTLYAQSICPDEINHESGDITELFSKHMGEVRKFSMCLFLQLRSHFRLLFFSGISHGWSGWHSFHRKDGFRCIFSPRS